MRDFDVRETTFGAINFNSSWYKKYRFGNYSLYEWIQYDPKSYGEVYMHVHPNNFNMDLLLHIINTYRNYNELPNIIKSYTYQFKLDISNIQAILDTGAIQQKSLLLAVNPDIDAFKWLVTKCENIIVPNKFNKIKYYDILYDNGRIPVLYTFFLENISQIRLYPHKFEKLASIINVDDWKSNLSLDSKYTKILNIINKQGIDTYLECISTVPGIFYVLDIIKKLYKDMHSNISLDAIHIIISIIICDNVLCDLEY